MTLFAKSSAVKMLQCQQSRTDLQHHLVVSSSGDDHSSLLDTEASEPHGDRRRWRLQLLVQQPEEHGAFVALRRLSQRAVQLSLQVVDVPQPLFTVQPGEVGCSLLQRVDSQCR